MSVPPGGNAAHPSPEAIRCLLRPRSVAVIGASNDPTKFGGKVARNLARSSVPEKHFVNARGEAVLGQPAARSLDDIARAPEAVVLAVPADASLEALERAGARGVRAAVVFASGFGESGEAGRARERALRRIAERYGMAMLGPNCVGAANFADGVLLSSADGLEVGPPGPIALLSQSGSLGIATSCRQARRFSHFVSTGSEIALTSADLLTYLAQNAPEVRAFALMVEAISDREALARALELARADGKRVVMLKLNGDEASDRIAAMHTGALSGARAPFEAFCRDHGAVVVSSLRELNATLALLATPRYAGGRRLGIYTTSGGTAVLGAGLATARGLALPQPGAATRASVGEILGMDPQRVTNPLDTTGINAFQPARFGEALARFAADGAFDLVLVPLGGAQGADAAARVDVVVDAAARAAVPIVPVWQLQRLLEEEAFVKLYASGLPMFPDVESVIEAMRLLAGEPVAADEVGAGDDATRAIAAHSGPRGGGVRSGATNATGASPGPSLVEVLEDLERAGLSVARVVRVPDPPAAASVLAALGPQVALKASHPRLIHKSDAGMVVYPVDSVERFEAEVARMRASAGMLGLDGVEIVAQAGAERGVELLCGFDRDPEMGCYVVLAAGGIYTEVLRDSVVVLLEPAAELPRRLLAGLQRLRIWPLLAGARGRPRLAVDAAVAATAALGAHFLARGQWAALEVNPLVVSEREARVVDARVISRPSIP